MQVRDIINTIKDLEEVRNFLLILHHNEANEQAKKISTTLDWLTQQGTQLN